eukprot:TRINITY_DN6749_c0_g1_i1.p1 TRINITY_DN6749_c0_g1~~TRINITY_DN6749_c0_g1_i1.p1  ORF type:complete len:191 (-),score=26.33 TRINITY_DN6749_c0_g1_i1:693-1265(-)
MAPAGRKCGVCSEASFKYKCPSCALPYCSLTCYRQHKEVPCSKGIKEGSPAIQTAAATLVPDGASFPGPLPAAAPAATAIPPPVTFSCAGMEEAEEMGWRLSRSQLQAIASSEELRLQLRNQSGLQQLIGRIDASSNPEAALEKEMRDPPPAFLNFTEQILCVLDPARKQGDSAILEDLVRVAPGAQRKH